MMRLWMRIKITNPYVNKLKDTKMMVMLMQTNAARNI